MHYLSLVHTARVAHMASKEEKLTCPALAGRAAGPALGGRAAGHPACGSAAGQQAGRGPTTRADPGHLCATQGGLAAEARAVGVVWLGGDRCSLVLSALLARRVGAHSVALVLYCFNTDQCAMYCVLYVFLFIFYNTVFFIMEP